MNAGDQFDAANYDPGEKWYFVVGAVDGCQRLAYCDAGTERTWHKFLASLQHERHIMTLARSLLINKDHQPTDRGRRIAL